MDAKPSKRGKGARKAGVDHSEREPLGEKPANVAAPKSAGSIKTTTASKRKNTSDNSNDDNDHPIPDQDETGKPPAKKAKTSSTTSAPQRKKNTKAKGPSHADLSDVHLPGEDKDAVRVFESCGEIRKKIAAYLKRDGVKQVDFLKELVAQFHTSDGPMAISPATFRNFRSKKGVLAGNTSCVYYAAYIFFEKLRIKEGKPKSKNREEMEEAWPTGIDITSPQNTQGVFCGPGQVPYTDKFGKVRMGGRMPRVPSLKSLGIKG